jgi:hypothetical protein
MQRDITDNKSWVLTLFVSEEEEQDRGEVMHRRVMPFRRGNAGREGHRLWLSVLLEE